MFPLLGAVEVLALLIVGGVSAPMFLLPTHRGGNLLRRKRIVVRKDKWPAVYIDGEHVGALARLQALFKRRPHTVLEVAEPKVMRVEIRRLFRPRMEFIPLDRVVKAGPKPWHPMYHIPAIGVVGFVMMAYGQVGRLTPVGVGFGLAVVGLCGALSTVQRTINLVIEIEGKKPIVLPFSTMPFQKDILPEELHEELREVARRLTELAVDARGLSNSQRSSLNAQDAGAGWFSRLRRQMASAMGWR